MEPVTNKNNRVKMEMKLLSVMTNIETHIAEFLDARKVVCVGYHIEYKIEVGEEMKDRDETISVSLQFSMSETPFLSIGNYISKKQSFTRMMEKIYNTYLEYCQENDNKIRRKMIAENERNVLQLIRDGKFDEAKKMQIDFETNLLPF